MLNYDFQNASASPLNAQSSHSHNLTRYFQFISIFLLGFLACQRFTLPAISPYVCIVPLGLSVLMFYTRGTSLCLAFCALVLSVDTSELAYANTPSAIRLLSLGIVFLQSIPMAKPNPRHLMLLIPYVVTLIGLTSFNFELTDNYTLIRDIITLIFALSLLAFWKNFDLPDNLDQFILAASTGMLASELANVIFYYDPGSIDYLSYTSLKGFITFASIHMTSQRGIFASLPIILASIYALMGLKARTIVIVYFLVLYVAIIRKIKYWPYRIAIFVITIAMSIALSEISSSADLDINRTFNVISALSSSTSVSDYLQQLDPIRFSEASLFFDRNIFEIILGSGLGSGLHDTHYFFLDVVGNGAFSDDELASGYFFRLHDAWLFFSLRFGLLPVILTYIFLFRQMVRSGWSTFRASAYTFISLNCFSFSLTGLAVTYILFAKISVELRREQGSQ